MSTKIRRILLAGLLLVGGTSLFACAWSPKAPTYPLAPESLARPLLHRLRTPAEHDRARARVGMPYILEARGGEGALLYYGAHHSTDPDHPQVADIESRWQAFAPTVALCEGRRNGHMLGWPFEALFGLPEPALVHRLARRDGVHLYSLEPEYADEVRLLLREFAPEQVALYFTLRVYAAESGGEADEGLFLHLAGKRTAVEELRGTLPDVETADALWGPELEHLGDWRELEAIPGDTWLGELDRASRRARGEHMARALLELVESGERVFAVVGSGHVIRQEWALRAALGADPAPDQPPPGSSTGREAEVPGRAEVLAAD